MELTRIKAGFKPCHRSRTWLIQRNWIPGASSKSECAPGKSSQQSEGCAGPQPEALQPSSPSGLDLKPETP